MLIVFSDQCGIVHKFMPTGTTVNAAIYVQVLTHMQNHVMHMQQAIAKNWKLHHDNARCVTVQLRQMLAKFGMVTLPCPRPSPIQPRPGFFLSPRMKRELKGYRFDSIKAVQAATTKAFNSVPAGF